MQPSDSSVTLLPWDSEFFGRRIARVEGQTLTAARVTAIAEWCGANNVECAYFLADPTDAPTIVEAERWGAHFTDIRTTLRIEVPEYSGERGVRMASSGDLAELCEIARESHRDGRFFFDSHFPTSRCEDFYQTWIVRSCEGFADAVLVPDIAGKAGGYVTCSVDRASGIGRIGLFAVGAAHRGKGIGRDLIGAAMHWFRNNSVTVVDVTTQGRNVAAQRLYINCGFRPHSLLVWYHKWFVDE